MDNMDEKKQVRTKLSKATIIICIVAVLFAGVSILISNNMRKTARRMYEHPYTVTNSARAMRSRLLDMKSFVNILMTYNFKGEKDIHDLFQERYDFQQSEIDRISKRYLGPKKDVEALQEAMDRLIECQDQAIVFAQEHEEDAILTYIEQNVYPYYDDVSSCLETIISFSDAKIYSLSKESDKTAFVSISVAVLLSGIIIVITVLSNRREQESIKKLIGREKDLQDALLLAQKAGNAKKDFLSRMSHEIRTPMNVIVGMTTIAGAHLEDKTRMKDCLTKISFSSRHLLALINDVLDMSKIEEGKLTICREEFRIQQLIESVVSVIYPQSVARGSEFSCDVSGVTSELFVGDSLRINQILLNILSNAVKFTPRGGEIRLSIFETPVKNGRTNLVFTVRDTGIGMSREFLDRLFLPFEQEDGTISRKYGGSGLGMAITHNLVELLDGTIQVKSELGAGTEFTVKLPFEVPEMLKEDRKQFEELKVLVVDDDENTCTHAALLLKHMGIDAQWVKNGSQAVEMVVSAHEEYRDYDVCFIDWRMPDMDGVEVTRRIRSQIGPDMLIIIISAYDWSVIEGEARSAGADAFISKPLFEAALYDVLKSVTSGQTGEEEKQAENVSFEGRRFLLAEDNELNREIAAEILRETGAEFESVCNGKEAVECFEASEKGYYDLILMDIQMPVMSGYEATRKIRSGGHADAQSVPIVAMTANAFREDEEMALDAGMNAHIAKPIDIGAFYRTIKKVLEERDTRV